MITSMVTPMITGMITSMIRSSVTGRWFISLDAVANSYYEISSAITFAGDFEIEAEFSTVSTDASLSLWGDAGTDTDWLRINGSTSTYEFKINNSFVSTGAAASNDGKLHKAKFARTGTGLELFEDDVSIYTTTKTVANYIIGNIGARNTGAPINFFDGILANVSINDIAGAEVTTFELNEPTLNTESSVEGNNTVTYNNISAAIREFFTLVDDGVNWLGADELVTNGTFDADSDWVKGTGWSIAGGAAVGTAATGFLQQTPFEFDAGLTYRTIFTVKTLISGSVKLRISNSAAATGTVRTAIGTYTEDLTTDSDDNHFNVIPSTMTGTVDDITVKRLIEIA